MKWIFDQNFIDWEELSNLYKIAPLGEKSPEDLRIAFSNSMYKCFVFDSDILVGVGRALADGVDCSYLCDVAVHPDYQGHGLGKSIISKLKALSEGHKKIILYANPGKEEFYKKLGFKQMYTAMAVFKDNDLAANLVHRQTCIDGYNMSYSFYFHGNRKDKAHGQKIYYPFEPGRTCRTEQFSEQRQGSGV